jgi:hypothetical protein
MKLRTGNLDRRSVPLRAEVPDLPESVAKARSIDSGIVRADRRVCFEDVVDDESVEHSLHENEMMMFTPYNEEDSCSSLRPRLTIMKTASGR